MSKPILASLIACAYLCASGAVFAEGESATGQPADIGVIHVEADSLELSTRALSPKDIIVLRPQDWGAAKSVADALEKAAPASVSRVGGEGSMSSVSLRAAGAAGTLIMLNGIPVALPGGTQIDLALFDLSSVERIEVLPGGATVHGTRALGGVVNIITRSGDDGSGRKLDLALGSFGTAKGAISAAKKLKSGREFWQASAITTQGDYTFTTNNGLVRTRENNDTRRANLLWQRQDYSEKELRTVFASLAGLRRGVPGFAEFPTLTAELTEQALVCGLAVFKPAVDKGWSKELGLSLAQGYIRFKDDKPAMGGAQRSRAADATLHLRAAFTRESGDASTDACFSASGNAMSAAEYGDPKRVTARASFAHAWQLGDFELIPSAALDLCTDNPEQVTWDVRCEWQATGKLALVAGAGSSFRLPEFAELYYPSQGFVTGNPGLRPERAITMHSGLRYKTTNVSIRASAFDRTQHDAIRFLPVSAALLKPMNTGKSRAKGIEADCSLLLAPGLTANVVYAWTKAAYSQSGIDFTQTPRHRFSCSLRYDDGMWTGSASLLCESSQSADLFGSVRVPAQERFDVAVSRNLGSGRLELVASNLLDKNNRDYWDLPLPGRALEVMWYKDL